MTKEAIDAVYEAHSDVMERLFEVGQSLAVYGDCSVRERNKILDIAIELWGMSLDLREIAAGVSKK